MGPEFGLPFIREIIFKSYRVVYRLNHDARVVEVSRFWQGTRGTPDFPGRAEAFWNSHIS